MTKKAQEKGCTDPFVRWGSIGQTGSSVQARIQMVGIRKVSRRRHRGVNANHPPQGFDAAVTCDRGLALLAEITGAPTTRMTR